MTKTLQRFINAAAAAVLLGVIASPAQAAFYFSRFDPPDFNGTAVFEVSDACLGRLQERKAS